MTLTTAILGITQNIFFGMLRGSYVPNLEKIGPKLWSQTCPQTDGRTDGVRRTHGRKLILYSVQRRAHWTALDGNNKLIHYHYVYKRESRAVARKPRDAAAVLFRFKFADNIHYKFKSSQASKARLHSSKHTGTKQNLRQNGDLRSFKVTCFGVSGKAIRH